MFFKRDSDNLKNINSINPDEEGNNDYYQEEYIKNWALITYFIITLLLEILQFSKFFYANALFIELDFFAFLD